MRADIVADYRGLIYLLITGGLYMRENRGGLASSQLTNYAFIGHSHLQTDDDDEDDDKLRITRE